MFPHRHGTLFSNQSICTWLHHQTSHPGSHPQTFCGTGPPNINLPLAQKITRDKNCPGIFRRRISKCIFTFFHIFNIHASHFFHMHFQNTFFTFFHDAFSKCLFRIFHILWKIVQKWKNAFWKCVVKKCEKMHFGNVKKMHSEPHFRRSNLWGTLA